MSYNPARPEGLPATHLESIAQTVGATFADTTATNGDVEVNGVSSSTNTVVAGSLFVALPGARTHGAKFSAKAAESGATAVLTDPTGVELASEAGLPVLVHPDPRAVLGQVAALVYGTHRDSPVLIGVTGTNGKTTTAYLVDALLRALDVRSGLSGTVERRIGDTSITTRDSGRLTTPEADDLHALNAAFRLAEVEAAAIEVSAQAITHHRIDGLFFSSAIFTNFAQDHLDDYGTMDNYFASKLALFTPDRVGHAVTLVDDEWGARLANEAKVPVTTISTDAQTAADWHVTTREVELDRTEFTLTSPDGRSLTSWVNQPGSFVAVDLALAVVALVEAGFAFDRFLEALDNERGVEFTLPGRLDPVNAGGSGPRVYVDYGHTPASFAAVLTTLRQFTKGRLFMVFGADGDRDQTKRPDMARSAAIADVVVVTDYNPRFEDPAAIRKTLVDTLHTEFPDREVYEIGDSAEGIAKAVSLANENDIIFVGGHGHRQDVEVRGTLVPYSVKDAVREALRASGWDA
ncbi:Mur ligase family protein [Gulosibacter sediminis]|uniref:Mur ligase family protein n=1 Tax=Gulosibacter sediminis TaxID=1729695 RepID=UPI0024AD1546|nr:UDP-N-acetylmuramoyl-L-alanyl-D-glutamate--2,6-diaminopimelate ligase [Gulosibacter sediminis]